ncbi:MAG TPA: MBL fold metallo-hydrolase [Dissulfurispiraceae bacterium]|nr:MBL fold metallo-hydrolase [Dissulfurispiraceae bacterium]
MIFSQFHNESLGHASYFVGSEKTGEALIVDARRDTNIYFEEARNQGMRITYALDTHQHNDYVSGIREIAARADVKLFAGSLSTVGYDAAKLSDAGKFRMGEVAFTVLHTQGHTPEHICLLITDLSRGEEPTLLLSGGCLLVDDIGRPDLLGGTGAVEANARELYRSLYEKIMRLPDHVEVYPTHVAGSLCGGNIGSRLSTTIGYERKLNIWLKYPNRDKFIEACLKKENLPAIPPYWRHMREINQSGPSLLGILAEPPALGVAEFDRLRKEGTYVLDCRSPEAFSAHIPGALHAGAGTSFPTWAGTVLPFAQPYLVVIERAKDLQDIIWHMLRIGYDLPKGWLADGMTAWRAAGREIQPIQLWTVWDLENEIERIDDLFVLDVRQPREWAHGHIEGAHHITGAEIPEHIREVPQDRQVAVICGSGYRSSSVASILQSRGYKKVASVLGGMSAWRRAGFRTTK